MQITLQDFTQNMGNLLNIVTSDAIDNIMANPVLEALKEIKNRVTDRGENTNGGQIGQYDTKEMYAPQKAFAKPSAFRGVGKHGGTPRKTMYLGRGYKELRDIQALRTDFINLQYRGDLINDYRMQKVARDFVIGFTNEKNKLIREGQEDKADSLIFTPSTDEIADYYKNIDRNLEVLTISTLNGQTITLSD